VTMQNLEHRYSQSKTVPQTRQAHKYIPDDDRLCLYETSKDTSIFGMVTRPIHPAIGISNLAICDWVAAVYDGCWYYGEIINIDMEHEEYEISYLKEPGSDKRNKTFTRENRTCYVPFGHILQQVTTPKSTRTGRTFSWDESTRNDVQEKFEIFTE